MKGEKMKEIFFNFKDSFLSIKKQTVNSPNVFLFWLDDSVHYVYLKNSFIIIDDTYKYDIKNQYNFTRIYTDKINITQDKILEIQLSMYNSNNQCQIISIQFDFKDKSFHIFEKPLCVFSHRNNLYQLETFDNSSERFILKIHHGYFNYIYFKSKFIVLYSFLTIRRRKYLMIAPYEPKPISSHFGKYIIDRLFTLHETVEGIYKFYHPFIKHLLEDILVIKCCENKKTHIFTLRYE